MVRQYGFICTACLIIAGCAPSALRDRGTEYSVTVVYTSRSFTPEIFSGQSLLILPMLTAGGPSKFQSVSPSRQGLELLNVRKDLQIHYAEEFEEKYYAAHPKQSLLTFYQRLYNNEVIATETNDSVWKSMDAQYLFVVKLKYAAVIRGFDGNTRKRLGLEVEIWDIRESETVWRADVKGMSKGIGRSDEQFLSGAIGDVFGKLPRLNSGTQEDNNW